MIFQHVTRKHIRTHTGKTREHSFYDPVMIVRGHLELPLSVRLSICLSVRLSVCLSVLHTLRNRVCVLLKFSVDLFETLRTCCGHNENMYMDF